MRTRLGQNFLTDDSVAKRIADSANLSSRDNVLEIGPGKGILTKHLAEYTGKVLAVEIDKGLANALKNKYAQVNDRLLIRKYGKTKYPRIINDDILKINLPELIEKNDFQNYKVVANLPYYITSPIIRMFLETKYPPSEMVLMVQKEVGERIVALDGKESILSISVKFYADPEIVFEVGRKNFDPVPEVDSAVIRIKRRKNPLKAGADNFFPLVRAGFSSKRKTLVNNLANGFHVPKEKTAEITRKAGLDPTIRAEKLKMEDWVKLCDNFEF